MRSGAGSDGLGTVRLAKSGTAEKLIAIKGAGDGEMFSTVIALLPSDYYAGADYCGFHGFLIELHLHDQNVPALPHFARNFAR